MLGENVARLVGIASPPLGAEDAEECFADIPKAGGLCDLLKLRNGFYAFESALHVFASCNGGVHDITAWNKADGWKAGYDSFTRELFFFAEDIFGVQFGLRDGDVFLFDPETGEASLFANDCEEWAGKILAEYEFHTGYPIAHRWQIENGPIPFGYRLIPRIPFVLGGAFALSNLALMECATAMRLRASIASQIAGFPDGTKVKLKVVD